MEAKDRLIVDLVGKKDDIFSIPSYQRKYKWTSKGEVQELLDDLENFIITRQLDFFLGAIVVKMKNNLDREYVLVDGQQRITTFLLIIAAINTIIKKEDSFKFKISSLLETNEGKFKLKRINDQKILKFLIDGKVGFLNESEKKSNYYLVYDFLLKYFKKKKREDLENFYFKGLEKINLAVIRLNNDEDEFLVFESINSKGKGLSSNDLIKNYIMMQLAHDEDLEDYFENSILSKFEEKELEDFYRQFLALMTGNLYAKTGRKLYYGFKKRFPKELINQDFIANLEKECEIWKWIRKQNFSCLTYPILETNFLNYYTIIHTLVAKNIEYYNNEIVVNQINFDKIENGLIKLASVAIRRMLFGHGRVESNRSFASIGSKYYLGKEWTIDKVINELTMIGGNARTPSWIEVEGEINKVDLYSRHRDILRWTLIAIEEKMSNKKILHHDITIEHIYPQKPSKDWNLDYRERMEMDFLLNTLGNLSITRDNSSLGNNVISRKKEILANKSYLKINKMIYQINEWNFQEIKNRATQLLIEIKKYWGNQ